MSIQVQRSVVQEFTVYSVSPSVSTYNPRNFILPLEIILPSVQN